VTRYAGLALRRPLNLACTPFERLSLEIVAILKNAITKSPKQFQEVSDCNVYVLWFVSGMHVRLTQSGFGPIE
jgi:hypothetical protein